MLAADPVKPIAIRRTRVTYNVQIIFSILDLRCTSYEFGSPGLYRTAKQNRSSSCHCPPVAKILVMESIGKFWRGLKSTACEKIFQPEISGLLRAFPGDGVRKSRSASIDRTGIKEWRCLFPHWSCRPEGVLVFFLEDR